MAKLSASASEGRVAFMLVCYATIWNTRGKPQFGNSWKFNASSARSLDGVGSLSLSPDNTVFECLDRALNAQSSLAPELEAGVSLVAGYGTAAQGTVRVQCEPSDRESRSVRPPHEPFPFRNRVSGVALRASVASGADAGMRRTTPPAACAVPSRGSRARTASPGATRSSPTSGAAPSRCRTAA